MKKLFTFIAAIAFLCSSAQENQHFSAYEDSLIVYQVDSNMMYGNGGAFTVGYDLDEPFIWDVCVGGVFSFEHYTEGRKGWSNYKEVQLHIGNYYGSARSGIYEFSIHSKFNISRNLSERFSSSVLPQSVSYYRDDEVSTYHYAVRKLTSRSFRIDIGLSNEVLILGQSNKLQLNGEFGLQSVKKKISTHFHWQRKVQNFNELTPKQNYLGLRYLGAYITTPLYAVHNTPDTRPSIGFHIELRRNFNNVSVNEEYPEESVASWKFRVGIKPYVMKNEPVFFMQAVLGMNKFSNMWRHNSHQEALKIEEWFPYQPL